MQIADKITHRLYECLLLMYCDTIIDTTTTASIRLSIQCWAVKRGRTVYGLLSVAVFVNDNFQCFLQKCL